MAGIICQALPENTMPPAPPPAATTVLERLLRDASSSAMCMRSASTSSELDGAKPWEVIATAAASAAAAFAQGLTVVHFSAQLERC
jgi:hypothetical protein